MKKGRTGKAYRVALLGMLFALAIVLSLVEGMLTPLLGLQPGVKPGLANIVVMYALFFLGASQAATLVGLKAFFVLLTRGIVAGALSVCGGMAALFVMLLARRVAGGNSYFILSVSGAIAHNVGQLCLVNLLLTRSVYTFYYLPVLLISGLVMGSLTSLSLKALLPALGKINCDIIEKKSQ